MSQMQQFIIMSREAYEVLLLKFDFIINKLTEREKEPKNELLTNEQFMAYLGISRRTAQNYRDQGLVPFSQVGNKIYYRKEDVDAFINSYKIKANGSSKRSK